MSDVSTAETNSLHEPPGGQFRDSQGVWPDRSAQRERHIRPDRCDHTGEEDAPVAWSHLQPQSQGAQVKGQRTASLADNTSFKNATRSPQSLTSLEVDISVERHGVAVPSIG